MYLKKTKTAVGKSVFFYIRKSPYQTQLSDFSPGRPEKVIQKGHAEVQKKALTPVRVVLPETTPIKLDQMVLKQF